MPSSSASDTNNKGSCMKRLEYMLHTNYGYDNATIYLSLYAFPDSLAPLIPSQQSSFMGSRIALMPHFAMPSTTEASAGPSKAV